MLGRTMIVTIDLPTDRDWVWLEDLDILGLATHLDAPGRDRAIDDFMGQWRATLRAVA